MCDSHGTHTCAVWQMLRQVVHIIAPVRSRFKYMYICMSLVTVAPIVLKSKIKLDLQVIDALKSAVHSLGLLGFIAAQNVTSH